MRSMRNKTIDIIERQKMHGYENLSLFQRAIFMCNLTFSCAFISFPCILLIHLFLFDFKHTKSKKKKYIFQPHLTKCIWNKSLTVIFK